MQIFSVIATLEIFLLWTSGLRNQHCSTEYISFLSGAEPARRRTAGSTSTDVKTRLVYQLSRLSSLIWIDSFFCKIDWINSFFSKRVDCWLSPFVFIKKVIKSIDFERLVLLNLFYSKIIKKVNKIEGFQKNQLNRRFSREMSTKYWLDWLIWLHHLSYSCELLESVHMFLVTWLNWLIYSSCTDSWWSNQYLFTFCHDWIDSCMC